MYSAIGIPNYTEGMNFQNYFDINKQTYEAVLEALQKLNTTINHNNMNYLYTPLQQQVCLLCTNSDAKQDAQKWRNKIQL